MKNVKKSLITLGVIALGLVSCGKPSDASAPSAPSENVSVSVPEDDTTIQFIKAPTTLERGNTITLRVSVMTENDDMTAIFQSEQDGEIIDMDTNSTGVTSIKITGLAVGKATITAIASCNHKVKTSITIEVTPRLSSLQTVWKNLAKMKNYTLTSKDADENVTHTLKVTENALTATNGPDGTYSQFKMNDKGEMDANATSATGVAGLAIDANGYAYYLVQDGDTFKAPGTIVKANVGLLNVDNFTGLGTNANSWLEVEQSFFGLAAINPSWLPSTKATTNSYAIQYADDTDHNTAFAEALLVGLVAPELEEQWLVAEGKSSFTAFEVSDAFETSVNVISNTDVSITVSYNSTSVVATLSGVGTTEQDASVKSFLTAHAKSVATAPELNSDLQVIQSAVLAGDYTETSQLSIGSFNGSVTTYTTSNYVFNDYPQEFIDAYKAQTGKDLAAGGVFVTGTKGDTLQAFTYNRAVVDSEGTVTTPASITLGKSMSLANPNLNNAIMPFCLAWDTLGGSLSFLTDLIYTFSQANYNGQSFFISTSQDVSDDLFEKYFGETLGSKCSSSGLVMDSYSTVLTPTFDTTGEEPALTALSIEYGSFYESGKGPYAYTQKLAGFGHATENSVHQLLVENGLAASVTIDEYLANFGN